MTIEELKKQKYYHLVDEKEKEKLCYEILNYYNKTKKEKINFYQLRIDGFRVITQKLNDNTFEFI